MSAGLFVRDFGARGDGIARDGAAIQAAIDEAGAAGGAISCGAAPAGRAAGGNLAGGGLVVLEPGIYLSGSLFLRSGVELRIESGAILLASGDPADFPVAEARWEGVSRPVHASLISGERVSRIAITGRGRIDGRGAHWWRRFREGSLDVPRPRLLSFTDCEDVLIEGVSLVNSPSWTVNPVRSRRVVVRGVSIDNPADSPNTDGINPDSCQGVIIEGCHISAGDDCVTIKAGTEDEAPGLRAACRDIVVANCVMEAGHGGVVIGSEMSGGVSNVVVSNCVMRGTDRGIRFKSRRGRGGAIEDVRIANIIMEDVRVPLAINLRYHCGGAQGNPIVADRGARPVDEGTPHLRRLSLTGLSARGAVVAAAWIEGLAEAPVEDLHLSDVYIELAPGAAASKPEAPEMADGMPVMAGAGFLARHVKGLRLDRVEVRGQAGPDFSLENCVG